jgi:hypothetical protein
VYWAAKHKVGPILMYSANAWQSFHVRREVGCARSALISAQPALARPLVLRSREAMQTDGLIESTIPVYRKADMKHYPLVRSSYPQLCRTRCRNKANFRHEYSSAYAAYHRQLGWRAT